MEGGSKNALTPYTMDTREEFMPSSLVGRPGGPSPPVLERPRQVKLNNATPARTPLPTSDKLNNATPARTPLPTSDGTASTKTRGGG